MNKKLLVGCGLGAVALVSIVAMDGQTSEVAPPQHVVAQQDMGDQSQPPSVPQQPVDSRSGEAQQALVGLIQIRQQQCQMGNQLACQVLPEMPARQQKLAGLDQACRSGDRNACGEHQQMAQTIITAYSESAAVMRAGEAGMAQMNNWRAQMNSNAAASMANLQARAAAGQAAHNARQESYAAMNRNWEAGQASAERTQGRFIDGIYEGTTMDGGGVQSRIPYGSTGYTDGRGNVVAVPNGGQAPDGWQAMNPTYAAPN